MSWLGIALFTRVNSFVEVLIKMACKLKITLLFKKMCKNSMVFRHSVKELLSEKQCYAAKKYIVEVTKILWDVSSKLYFVKWIPPCRLLLGWIIRQIRIIVHHQLFPHQKTTSQCLEFTQMMYWPHHPHFGIENDGLIISWYKIRWCPIIRTCLIIQYLPQYENTYVINLI